MPGNYTALAPIYDRAGMGEYARLMTPRMLNFAQQNEWMGRRILELGCGSGVGTTWFAEKGYAITGVDNSLAMLTEARKKAQTRSLNMQLLEGDIRTLDGITLDPVDLVIAVDVLNDLESVRELEAVFQQANRVLVDGRMLVFDLHTIEGLAQNGMDGDRMLVDEDDLAIFLRTRFDFERQSHSALYDVFARDDNGWMRARADRVQRVFPVQAVATLLRRQKFEVKAVIDSRFQPFDFNTSSAPRVIFLAQKGN